mmetsp:Transcript_16233/g.18809  ORF Transcript_16233/g.18809 Transcript_16233/m.18809 type:complete len:173 (-) Transcript_16233:257-775(-)
MTKKTYKRISNVDHDKSSSFATSNATASSPSPVPSSTPQKTISQKISEKLHAIFFISLAYFTINYTDTISILFTSQTIIRPLLYIAITQITINTILLLYLTIYLSKIKGLKDSSAWQVYCPRIIPIITFNGVLCGCLLIRCFWPVWGFCTPFILGVEFFGLIFVSHFVPWIF